MALNYQYNNRTCKECSRLEPFHTENGSNIVRAKTGKGCVEILNGKIIRHFKRPRVLTEILGSRIGNLICGNWTEKEDYR